jgi:hypothetical protein
MWISSKQYFITKGGIIMKPPQFISNQLPKHININFDEELR